MTDQVVPGFPVYSSLGRCGVFRKSLGAASSWVLEAVGYRGSGGGREAGEAMASTANFLLE